MPTYKVVEKKTRSFVKGRTSALQLEVMINEHASEGWTLDRIVSGDAARIMGLDEKDRFLLIFKKD